MYQLLLFFLIPEDDFWYGLKCNLQERKESCSNIGLCQPNDFVLLYKVIRNDDRSVIPNLFRDLLRECCGTSLN